MVEIKEEKKDSKKEEKVSEKSTKVIEEYEYKSKNIPITITILKKKGEFVPIYDVAISSISRTTEFILEKIRQELIKRVNLGMVEITDVKKTQLVEDKFEETISDLVNKYFPDLEDETKSFLKSYLIGKSLGLGNIELLMSRNRH